MPGYAFRAWWRRKRTGVAPRSKFLGEHIGEINRNTHDLRRCRQVLRQIIENRV